MHAHLSGLSDKTTVHAPHPPSPQPSLDPVRPLSANKHQDWSAWSGSAPVSGLKLNHTSQVFQEAYMAQTRWGQGMPDPIDIQAQLWGLLHDRVYKRRDQ